MSARAGAVGTVSAAVFGRGYVFQRGDSQW